MARGTATILKSGLMVALALTCSSCSPSISIEPSGSGTNIQLSFYDPGIFWSSPMEACIGQLTVREEGWPHRRPQQVVWKIHAPGGKCIKLRELTIGRLPPGFLEDVQRLPLKFGHMYGAESRSEPFDGVSMAWFVCRGAPADARWKNDYRLADPPPRCRG